MLFSSLSSVQGCVCVYVCVCVCVCMYARAYTRLYEGKFSLRLEGGHRARGWVARDFSVSSEPCLGWCAAKRST